jgi:hypothetical protein
LWILISVLSARADDSLEGYYTEEEIRSFDPMGGPDQYHLRKTWYCGDRMLKDDAWYGKTIARFDLGKIWILDEQSKTYIEVSTSFIHKNAREGLAPFGIPREDGNGFHFPEDLYVRTETTKKIGLWDCYQVTVNPKYRSPEAPYSVFWYSTDVNFPVEMYGKKLMQLFGKSAEVEAFFQRLKQFEGYPVRVESHGNTEVTITSLMKIRRQTDVDPQLFEIPEGYFGMPLPDDMRELPHTP